MDEARLLSVLERIASALERLAPTISGSEAALPFDPAEADEYNAASDEDQREFWAYLDANPDAMASFEEAGLSSEDSNGDEGGDSEDEYGEEDQYDDYYDDDPWNQPEHYDKYAGTYAQDVADLSDEFIDDVLDGCPEAYWNLGWD
ncbi:MAG: hypothetical protein JW741_25360 [Sedimentisphaerales bacterium]|nr:hypothetical protein [Sedimentisphaerales bacterium]